MTRAEAIQLGLKQYLTDKTCKHGHHAPRYTKTAICTACHSTRNRDWNQKNWLRRAEFNQAWRDAH